MIHHFFHVIRSLRDIWTHHGCEQVLEVLISVLGVFLVHPEEPGILAEDSEPLVILSCLGEGRNTKDKNMK